MTQESGIPLPSMQDLKKLSQQELLDRLVQASYAIQEARKDAERRVAEEKRRGNEALDKLRVSTAQHNRELESDNKSLQRSLTRLQGDFDKLQEETMMLRVKLSMHGNGKGDESRPVTVAEPMQPGGVSIPIQVPTPQLTGDAIPPTPKPAQ
ncbi:MAG TPA: hypothetical protein VEN81_01355 [Planctomycetota bacterium]|jgi:ABC-type Na+ efflux pump permease subunit|nr:hypothetical protein [Planctomycetota bacterium]